MSPGTNGDRSQTRLLLIVAFLVIAIAAINFVNFATALTPMRIKSINTQKVLGSPNSHLRWGLILEAVGISLIAYLIALIIVYLLSVSAFATLITADMTLQANGHSCCY
ncbi:MAG: ABC transporter permease [Alistipes indistinctus]